MTDTQPSASALSDEKIREIFMAHGFTIKDGQTDLKPYVYEAARALLAALPAQVSEPIGYIKTTDLKFVATYSVQSQMVLYRDGNKNRTALYTAPPQAVVAQPVDKNAERLKWLRAYNKIDWTDDAIDRQIAIDAALERHAQAKAGDKHDI